MTSIPVLLVGVLLAAASVDAQGRPGPPAEGSAARYVDRERGLSLEQAIALARKQEPSLRAARIDVDVARGMRLQASLRPNPTVSIDRREEPGGTDNQTSASVEWPLDLFRKAGRVAVAERELQATEHSVADRERRLASEVRMQYGRVLAAVRDLTVSDDLLAATRRQHELLRVRVDEGATPPIERDLLDVELRRMQSEQVLQSGRTEAALFELKRLLGLASGESLTLRDALEDVVRRDRGVADLKESAAHPSTVTQRPDVQEAAARVEAAEARIDRARREGRFDVTLFGTYMRTDAGFPQSGLTASGDLARVRGLFHYVTGGAMVIMPLRNRNQGEIAAAVAARAAAAAEHEARQLAAQAEIASALVRDESAQRAVGVYTAGARTLARQNLDVVRQTYELGRATVFDVLAEQRRLLDVERAYTDALREAYEARTALKRALGDIR